jgi:hypothetical protein
MNRARDIARDVMSTHDVESPEWWAASRLAEVLRIVEEHRDAAVAAGYEPPGLVANIEAAVSAESVADWRRS